MALSSDMKMCLTRKRKRFLFRLCFDVICIGLMAAGILSIKHGTDPYHRGFFCDDQSIKHPLLHDTVTVPMAISVGLLLPIALIISVEAVFRKNQEVCILSQSRMFLRKKSWIMSTYDYIAVFIFGASVTQFLTEIGKYSIGRLRPHFLTLCNPDFSKLDCSKGYITYDVCTTTDVDRLKEARLSFPSGHSSFSMYCMFYGVLYLQTRLSCHRTPFLKPTVQIIFFSLGFFTCLSRISDYKHHWSDVLAGALLGMGVCLCIVRTLTDFGKLLFVPRAFGDVELSEVLSSPSTNFSEDVGDMSFDHEFRSEPSHSRSHTNANMNRSKMTDVELNI